jgi:Rod binding domain-containing protein
MRSLAPTSAPTSRDQLKGHATSSLEQEKARLKKATQEFEAFFRYQMMKAMRKTVPENPLSQGLPMSSSQGKDTFLDMMDMELSRAGSGGHGSIADILYRSTVKLIEAKYADTGGVDQSAVSQLPTRTVRHIPVRSKPKPVELPKEVKPVQIETKPEIAPLKPRISTSHDKIMEKFGPLIEAAAAETKLDSTLITSVIHAESRGNPKAVSQAGAKGLMQLMDGTAEDLGVKDSLDPEQNIMGGSRFLKKLMDRYQDIKLALAAYNAGPGNVDKYGGLPPFAETQNYVDKVMALFEGTTESPKVP